MGVFAGVIAYLGVLAVLVVGGAAAVVGLLSPTTSEHRLVSTYVPAKTVAAPAPAPAATVADATPVVQKTQRTGPAVVHRAPVRQARRDAAKPRTKVATLAQRDRSRRRGAERVAGFRSPGFAWGDDRGMSAFGYAPFDRPRTRGFF